MSYTHAQMVSQALTPKPSAFLSILGSTAMLLEIRAAGAKESSQRNCAVSRLLAGMCVSDLFFSAGWFLTTWPSPQENADWLWGASGNTQTCAAQGFFISIGFWGTPLYNTVVSFYYRAIIEWGWTDDRLRSYDKYVHGAIWLTLLLRGCFYLAYEYFNAYGVICWVTALPADCQGDECIRGDENTWKVGIFDQLFPIWPCLFLNAYFMARIYMSVRRVAMISVRRSSVSMRGSVSMRRNSSTSNVGLYNRLNDIKIQALLYVLAMFFCLVPDQIYALIYFTSPGRTYFNFWFETFSYIALPLQGYLNFVVFMRRQKRAHSTFGCIMMAPFRCCLKVVPERRSSSMTGTRRAEVTPCPVGSTLRRAEAGVNISAEKENATETDIMAKGGNPQAAHDAASSDAVIPAEIK